MNTNVKTNPKYFWSFLNSIKKSTSIPDVMNYNGSILKDPKDIVDKFADYFSKSFMVNNRNQQSKQHLTELVRCKKL
jgi:cell shape-determining protein MreC